MREIKYQGQRLDNGEWVAGSLVLNDNLAYIYIGHSCPSEVNFEYDFIPVDPATIGEYTGLTDKNAREVYEGCILTDKYESIAVVEWRNGAFVVNFGDVDIFQISDCFDDSYQMWIIGNIHDNPELLKECEL